MKRPIRIDGDVAYVTLTKGYECVIDAADAHLFDGYNWKAHICGRLVYGVRNHYTGEKWVSHRMHKIIMGDIGTKEVDHIDGDGLNNRRANLRAVTHAQNMKNQRLRSDNKSGCPGVAFHKRDGVWQAYIDNDGVRHNLGYHKCITSAAAAYREASAKLHGEFARTA
jgi:hypothetical protein